MTQILLSRLFLENHQLKSIIELFPSRVPQTSEEQGEFSSKCRYCVCISHQRVLRLKGLADVLDRLWAWFLLLRPPTAWTLRGVSWHQHSFRVWGLSWDFAVVSRDSWRGHLADHLLYHQPSITLMVIYRKIVQSPVWSLEVREETSVLPRCFAFFVFLWKSTSFCQFVARKLPSISEIRENDSAAVRLCAWERAAFVCQSQRQHGEMLRRGRNHWALSGDTWTFQTRRDNLCVIWPRYSSHVFHKSRIVFFL